jgi:hypothetical protein
MKNNAIKAGQWPPRKQHLISDLQVPHITHTAVQHNTQTKHQQIRETVSLGRNTTCKQTTDCNIGTTTQEEENRPKGEKYKKNPPHPLPYQTLQQTTNQPVTLI